MLWVNDRRVVFQFVVQGSGKCPGGLWGPSRILCNRYQHPGVHVARIWS